jgi:ketopantoate reductase
MFNNIVIIVGSGAIGRAFTLQLSVSYPNATIRVFSRHQPEKVLLNVKYHTIDYQDKNSIEKYALVSSRETLLDMVIVAMGILHDGELMPEKSQKELLQKNFTGYSR